MAVNRLSTAAFTVRFTAVIEILRVCLSICLSVTLDTIPVKKAINLSLNFFSYSLSFHFGYAR